MKNKVKNIILNLIIILILIISISYILYPIYDSRVTKRQSEIEAINIFEKNIEKQVQESSEKKISRVNISKYENKIVGILYIPKISLSLPIYDNVSEYAISNGVGLIKELGYPSENKGANPVLTSHSGQSTSSLFTNLERLEIKDPYYIKRYDGSIYKYQVFDIETVLPNQVEKLLPDPNLSMSTLLTCVPLGINSHRLLVKGNLVDANFRGDDIENNNFYLSINEVFSILLIFFMLIFISLTLKKGGKIMSKRRLDHE